MASFSSSSTKKISPASAYTLKLAWSGEQDIVNNTSTVTVTGTVSRNGSTYTAKNLNSGSINTVVIDTTTYEPTTKFNLMDYTSKEIFSYTQVVEHETDGNKTLDISWSFDGNTGGSYNPNGTISASIVLPTIHRTSSIQVTDGVFGKEIVISIDSKNEEFTHDLTYSFYDLAGTIAQDVKGNCSYVVPMDWLYQIPNDVSSKECVITCTTKYEDTIIGVSTYSNFVLTVPTSVVPIISSVAVTINESISGVSGFVQNKTSGTISISSSGAYGSEIKTTAVTLNGKSLTDITQTGVLTQSGTNIVNVKVTDSRSRVAEYNYSFEVMQYASPLISTFTVKRCILSDSSYVENDEEGTYAKVIIESEVVETIYSGTSPITLTLRYKKESDSSWTSTSFAYNDSVVTYLSGLETDSSYDFEITLSDVFETVVKTFSLASTHMIIDIHDSGRGVAVGKSSEKENTLEVGYTLDMNNNEIRNAKIVDLVYPVGSIYMSVNSTSPATLFGGTWSQLKDRFLLGAGNSYSVGDTGGETTVTLSTANLPSHSHGLNSHTHAVGTIAAESASLTGRATYRDVNTTDSNLILSASGILAYSTSDWSGSHWAMSGASASGYKYQHLDVDASHTHTISGSTAAASGNTTTTGSGTAHNNMPPYLAVYMWQRTE